MDHDYDYKVEQEENSCDHNGELSASQDDVCHVGLEVVYDNEGDVHDYEKNESNQAKKVNAARSLPSAENLWVPSKSRIHRWRHCGTRKQHQWTKDEYDSGVSELLRRVEWIPRRRKATACHCNHRLERFREKGEGCRDQSSPEARCEEKNVVYDSVAHPENY